MTAMFSGAASDAAPTTDALMRAAPVIPVLVLDDAAQAAPLAEALTAGGLPILEVTLRTPAALEAVRAMRDVPGCIVGVGTVTRPEQFALAREAGARFAVTPGTTPALLDAGRDAGLALLPGVATPSEVLTALAAGHDRLKFFPAGAAGGVPMLKALAGPFADVKFCPTGGVGIDNLRDYLALDNVLCVGGSWVAPADAVRAGDWRTITDLARAACAAGAGATLA